MAAAVSIPRRLVEEARRRGIDLESMIVELLARELELDPRDEARLHLELAEKYFREAVELLEKGDPVQASEKLYKAAEECIKILACLENLDEYRRA